MSIHGPEMITSGGGSQHLTHAVDNLYIMELMPTGYIGVCHTKFGKPEPRGENWHNHKQQWVAVPCTHYGQVIHDSVHAPGA